MFEHNTDNQALIASYTSYHLSIVREKKASNSINNYPQVSRWTCALGTGGLLFWQTKGSASLITAQEVWSRCRASFAMISGPCFCLHLRSREQENKRVEGIHSFWRLFQLLCQTQQATLQGICQGNQFTMCNHVACCGTVCWCICCKMQLWFQRAQEANMAAAAEICMVSRNLKMCWSR